MDQTSSLDKARNPKMSLGDLVDRTSFATLQMGWFGSPKAGYSRFLDSVMLFLWSSRPQRKSCLASNRE